MSLFKDETLMITGETRSFGYAILKQFLCTDIRKICLFFSDEKRLDEMHNENQTNYPELALKIKFHIGDVRYKSTLKTVMYGVDDVSPCCRS